MEQFHSLDPVFRSYVQSLSLIHILHNEYVLITLKDKETKIVASAEDKSGNTAEIQQTFTLEETNFYGYWLLVIPGLLGSLGLFWKVKHGKTKGS